MADLATSDDVAQALGLADAGALTTAQGLRVGALLSRVSREFRLEAGREFTPGTTTVRLMSYGDHVWLPDPVASVDDVTSATMRDRDNTVVTLTYVLDEQELLLKRSGSPLWSGVPVTVVYTHSGAAPATVAEDVAAIVARLLTVEPAAAQARQMTAGPFSRTLVDWASSTALLTDEERCTARSYGRPTPSIIITKP